MARTTKQDKVRELQRTLYRAAKADPGRRFHALYDKVYRRDVLERAWELVRANHGAAGIDQQTIADVEQYGVSRLLDELAADLKDGALASASRTPGVHPEARARGVSAALDSRCPRPHRAGGQRRSSLSRSSRLTSCACSFGFRPRRSAHDALQVLIDESWRGRRWVVESDIANCFEAIPHSRVDVGDRGAGLGPPPPEALARDVARGGDAGWGGPRRDAGTPQGGVISPVLATSICTGLTGSGRSAGQGYWFATRTTWWCVPHQAGGRGALGALRCDPGRDGPQLKAAKTRIVHLREGGEGLDFLGFHHRRVRGDTPGYRHLRFLARWPSRQAMQRRPRPDP